MKSLEELNGIKIGDFIKSFLTGKALLLTSIDDFGNGYPIFECNNNEKLRFYAKDCVKWVPEKNEYCCFKDKEEYSPLIAKYSEFKNGKYIAEIDDGKGSSNKIEFNICEPFFK